MATRPKGYLTKGKTKSVDAVRKAKAKEAFTPKGIGGMVAGALLSGAPIGRGGKAAVGVAKIIKQAITRKDPITTAAIKKSAKYIKNMDKLERKENKVTSLASAKTRANIDKMEKSGNYKKVGKAKPKPKSAMKTTTEYKKNRDKLEYGNPRPKPAATPTSAKPALSRVLRENRMRDLKAKKYQGSLSKEPKPLSKTPRLSNDTKKLLEKFQTPKVRPPATRTSLGGMIGDARPLAKGQRRQAAAEELKKRPVTKRKVNPEDIRKSRIEAAKAAKAARKNRIESLRKPVRPPRAKTNQNLTKNNRSGKYNKRGEELDLSTDKDIQTVRGKEYPDGFPIKSRFEGKTIESRSSQHPGSRGRNVKKVDEARKRKENVREKEIDKEVESRVNEGMKTYFPKANPNKRIPRRTLEDRRVQLKKQARSKRATAAADKAKYDKLTPAQRVRVKKILKEK